jgi:hypothetical protein
MAVRGEIVNASTTGRTPAVADVRRMNLVLPEASYLAAFELSRETHITLSELVRFGLALVKFAVEAKRLGNRLMITKDSGEPIKEIGLPL